jgi:hypothetical protein
MNNTERDIVAKFIVQLEATMECMSTLVRICEGLHEACASVTLPPDVAHAIAAGDCPGVIAATLALLDNQREFVKFAREARRG